MSIENQLRATRRRLRPLVGGQALHLVHGLELGEQRHVLTAHVGVLQAVPACRRAGGAADDVLERDGRTLARLNIAFGRLMRTDQSLLERTDVARILVDQVVLRLRRQLAGGSQVLNDLTQIGIDALVDLVAQVQMHAEHVVGAERLDRIG